MTQEDVKGHATGSNEEADSSRSRRGALLSTLITWNEKWLGLQRRVNALFVRERTKTWYEERDEKSQQLKLHEATGFGVISLSLLALCIATMYYWVEDFGRPLATYKLAECLVLESKQATKGTGYGKAPVSRAEISVFVFTSSMKECCCPDRDGKERCAEWSAIAYDTTTGALTTSDKSQYLIAYGHPGNFYPCWHSLDKESVVLSKDWNGEFLIITGAGFVLGIAAAIISSQKFTEYFMERNSRYKQLKEMDT